METEIEREDDAHHPVLGTIVLLYTLPVLLLTLYAYLKQDSWSVFCLGLVLVAAGTFFFTWLLRQWRIPVLSQPQPLIKLQETPVILPEPVDVTPYQEEISKLQSQMSAYEEMLKDWTHQADAHQEQLQQGTREKERLLHQLESLSDEHAHLKERMQEKEDEARASFQEYQNALAEQRDTLERKQHQLQQFETKIRDLNYEIKTLLQLAEKADEENSKTPESPKSAMMTQETFNEEVEVHDFEEALRELKHCIDAAQRIVGSSPFSNNSRFKDLSLDNFALDLRRLFDHLREIHQCTVFVYSPKENKMLFINPQVKALLGYTDDQFLSEFEEIAAANIPEWRIALSQLSFKSHTRVDLTLRNAYGQNLPVHCLIGAIPTGTFRHHVVGILFTGAF